MSKEDWLREYERSDEADRDWFGPRRYRDPNFTPRHDDPHYYDDEDARKAEEPPSVAKNVYTSPCEPREDFDDSDPAGLVEIEFCDDCGREIRGDCCSACREHDRRRDDPNRLAELRLLTEAKKGE